MLSSVYFLVTYGQNIFLAPTSFQNITFRISKHPAIHFETNDLYNSILLSKVTPRVEKIRNGKYMQIWNQCLNQRLCLWFLCLLLVASRHIPRYASRNSKKISDPQSKKIFLQRHGLCTTIAEGRTLLVNTHLVVRPLALSVLRRTGNFRFLPFALAKGQKIL